VIHRGKQLSFEEAPPQSNGTNGHTSNGHIQNGTAKKPKLFGHAVCSILLWMGKEGWDFTEARAVLHQLHRELADDTVRSQLSAGRTGRVPAPDLGQEARRQLLQLRATTWATAGREDEATE
jgi:hypothetical protein